MASSTKLLLLLAAVAMAAAADAAAKRIDVHIIPSSESDPKQPTSDDDQDASSKTCVRSLLAMSPCLPFFSDAGATAAPVGCCAGLRGIIDDQAVCLCHIVNHSLERAIGVTIPVDRAFTLLSDVCGLSPPQADMATCTNDAAVPPLYSCPAPSA